jgi:K+ transporter
MFWTTSVILFLFWLLGISVPFTAGGYIHILLAMSLVTVVIQFIRGRRDLARAKERSE